MKLKFFFYAMFAAALIVSCTGEDGDPGPQGEQGLQGDKGDKVIPALLVQMALMVPMEFLTW